jgi:hypothetical protein
MSDGMPVDLSPAEMFTLLDRETVRLQLPALPLIGMDEPLRIHLDLDAVAVDEIIERLTALRTQMLPAPTLN